MRLYRAQGYTSTNVQMASNDAISLEDGSRL